MRIFATLILACALAVVPALAHVVVLPTTARAAGINYVPRGKNDPSYLYFVGRIDRDDDLTFAAIAGRIEPTAIVTVMLDSPGGDMRAALEIGRTLRAFGFTARVANTSICNSGCALIWLSARYRLLDQHARLGLHSAQGPDGKRAESANTLIAFYLHGLGIPQDLISIMSRADPDSFIYVGYDELAQWGLLDEQAAKVEIEPMPPVTRNPVLRYFSADR